MCAMSKLIGSRAESWMASRGASLTSYWAGPGERREADATRAECRRRGKSHSFK